MKIVCYFSRGSQEEALAGIAAGVSEAVGVEDMEV